MDQREPEPDLTDPDNPEWTEEDFANARPITELHPPHIVAQLVRMPIASDADDTPAEPKVARRR